MRKEIFFRLIILLIVCFQQVNSQNNNAQFDQQLNIKTKFIQYGALYENEKSNSLMISQFNKGQKCLVLGYYGHDIYKIQYKKRVGFVTSNYLVVNDKMREVVKKFDKNQKSKVDKENIGIINQEQKTKVKQGAEAKAKEEVEVRVKVEEGARVKQKRELQLKQEAKLRLEQEAKVREDAEAKAAEAARIQVEQESRIKQEAEAKARKDVEAKAKAKEEAKQLADIAKAKAEDEAVKEKIRQKQIELKNKIQKEKNRIADSISRVNDSIAKIRKSCSYQMNETDKYYNIKIIKTENYLVNKDLHIELYYNGKTKYAFINYSGDDLGCVSYFTHNRSFAKIMLENNDVVIIHHTWNMDCLDFSLRGVLNDSAILKLEKSPIKSIKLQGTKGSVEIENLDYKEIFMDKLNCID